MKYVFLKDKEGFVSKKDIKDLDPDDAVISKEEFENLSGNRYYKQHFSHGGKREGAGRKQKLDEPLEYQIRVTAEEKAFITFAREKHFDYSKAMKS